jgi:hypothetical protein
MKYWFAYVVVFYAAWLTLAFGFGYWEQVKTHWYMAIVMVSGEAGE